MWASTEGRANSEAVFSSTNTLGGLLPSSVSAWSSSDSDCSMFEGEASRCRPEYRSHGKPQNAKS